jgi:hypothetical protein
MADVAQAVNRKDNSVILYMYADKMVIGAKDRRLRPLIG